MAKFKAVLYSAAVVMFTQTVLFAGTIGVEVTPNTWDAGTHGAGTFSTTGGHFTVANPGTDNAKMKIRATNTTPNNWVLSAVPGKDTFALQWQESGPTWNPILDTENTMFNSLTGGTQKSFDLSFLSPTSLTDPTLTVPQTTVVTLSAVSPVIGVWDMQIVDATAETSVGWPFVALDSDNIPHFAYRGNSLKYATPIGNIWNIQTVDMIRNIDNVSLVIGSNNIPHIVYYDNSSGSLKYAKWTGSNWDIQTVEDYTTVSYSVGEYCNIALDSYNNPYISYHDKFTNYLKCAKWTGSNWDIQSITKTGVFGTTIALDKNNNPYIAFGKVTAGVNSNLYLAKWTGSEWQVQQVDGSGVGIVGYYNSIKIDSNNNPHIAYMDSQNKWLKYAKWTGSVWDISSLDQTESGPISMDLDSNDQPNISYSYKVNSTVRNLQYINRKDGIWNIQTLDGTGGILGAWSSIIIDPNNCPHIAYTDSTNGLLKYVFWK